MKKLNRKGFTLIELLAVIVVLAIVLVVTIPSVLRSVNNARVKSLENSANAVADWLTRQSELAAIADTGITDDEVDEIFADLVVQDEWLEAKDSAHKMEIDGDIGSYPDLLLKNAGFGGGVEDASAEVWRNNDKICVKLIPREGSNSKSRFKGVPPQTTTGCE